MTQLTYLGNAEIDAFEGLYHQYQQDPFSVDREWRNFFEGFEFSKTEFYQCGVKKAVENINTMISDEMVWSSGGMCGKKQIIPVGMGGPAIKCKLNIGGR